MNDSYFVFLGKSGAVNYVTNADASHLNTVFSLVEQQQNTQMKKFHTLKKKKKPKNILYFKNDQCSQTYPPLTLSPSVSALSSALSFLINGFLFVS